MEDQNKQGWIEEFLYVQIRAAEFTSNAAYINKILEYIHTEILKILHHTR